MNSTAEPTATSVSLRNRMPPADMSIVSARCSSVSVFSITGRCRGNRIVLRKSEWGSGFISGMFKIHPTTSQSEVTKVPLKLPFRHEKMPVNEAHFPFWHIVISDLRLCHWRAPPQGNLSCQSCHNLITASWPKGATPRPRELPMILWTRVRSGFESRFALASRLLSKWA